MEFTMVKFSGEDKLQHLSLFILETQQGNTMLELYKVTYRKIK